MKFDERGRANLFVGYPIRQNGYKVYDATSGEIHMSRDVLFFDDWFPFKEKEAMERDKLRRGVDCNHALGG